MVDGEVLLNDFELSRIDPKSVTAKAVDAARELIQRAGLVSLYNVSSTPYR